MFIYTCMKLKWLLTLPVHPMLHTFTESLVTLRTTNYQHNSTSWPCKLLTSPSGSHSHLTDHWL